MKASRLSCLARSAIAHAFELPGVVGPPASDPDPSLEIDLASEQLLHVEARRGSDLLQLASARPDDDRLVAFLLDDDGGIDAPHAPQLLESIDHDVGAVGKLLAELAEQLLADEICRERALVPVGDFVGGVDRRLLGQIRLEGPQELI